MIALKIGYFTAQHCTSTCINRSPRSIDAGLKHQEWSANWCKHSLLLSWELIVSVWDGDLLIAYIGRVVSVRSAGRSIWKALALKASRA